MGITVQRMQGKVGLVTGAARGIGRSQAIRLAEEGADLILIDIERATDSVPYSLSSASDLEETAQLVRDLGVRVFVGTADVRDPTGLAIVVDAGVAELGRLDAICSNAGIISYGLAMELTEAQWRDVLDINLSGAWNTTRATVPHLRAGGRGGAIVFTSSTTGLRPFAEMSHYAASKHGLQGFAGSLAIELAPEFIRVNTINPGGVGTDMLLDPATFELSAPDLPEAERTVEAVGQAFQAANALPIPWVEPRDVANATLFLLSDEARYITGIALPIDAGGLLK